MPQQQGNDPAARAMKVMVAKQRNSLV